MPASRIFRFARTSRCASVASGTRKARAISGVSRPPTRLSVSATCASGGERRVAAGEDQLEPLVGNDGLLVVRELLGPREQLRLARQRLLAADPVDRRVAGRRDDPGAGIARRSVARPALGRADEGVLHRVLGEVEVTEDAAEDRDRARTLVAVGAGDLLYDATSASRVTIGRTSMWP